METLKLNDRLFESVASDCMVNVRIYLEKGADPTAINIVTGMNSLGLAAQKGNDLILSCLLAFDVQSNLINTSSDEWIDLCTSPTNDEDDGIEWEWDEEIDAEQGFSPDKEWLNLYSYYARMWENIGQVLNSHTENLRRDLYSSSLDRHHFGPIHYAAKYGHLDCVKLLINNYKCPVDLLTESGQSSLHLACENQHPHIVQFLLESGADPNRKTLKVEDTGLLKAAKNGNNGIIQMLLEHGANINLCNAYDVSPLIGATFFSHSETAKLLIKRGAKVNLQDRDGLTALVIAVHNESTEIVRALLDNGARIFQSHNLLHTAINLRNNDMIKMLISAGENITRNRDSYGLTPLEKLIQHGNLEQLQFCYNFFQLNHKTTMSNREIVMAIQIEDHNKFGLVLNFLLNAFQCDIDNGENALMTAIRLKKYHHIRQLIYENINVNTEFDYEFIELFSRNTADNLNILQHLVNAGLRIHKMKLLRNSCKGNDAIGKYLNSCHTNPLSLQQLLRIKLRNVLKASVHRHTNSKSDISPFNATLQKTGLPNILINYIYMFPDLS